MNCHRTGLLFTFAAAAPLFLISGGDDRAASLKKGLDTITSADAMRHVNYLASSELEGRDTGEPGCEKAAEYIAKQFERIGLEPFGDEKDGKRSYFQQYPITISQIDPKSGISAVTADGKKILLPLGTAVRGLFFMPPRDVSEPAPLVDGGTIELKPEPVDSQPSSRPARKRAKIRMPDSAHGALVLLRIKDFGGLGGNEVHSSVATAVTESGAAGVILADGGATDFREKFERGIDWGGRRSKREGAPSGKDDGLRRSNNPPIFVLSSTVSTDGLVGSKATFTIRSEAKEYHAANVVGVLRGTDPAKNSEFVVHSAHYDHVGVMRGEIYHGADDNASGSSCLMETAEAYKSTAPPRRSVIFVAVSGEEHGLWGSNYFTQHPPVPVTQLVADINTDMVGRTLLNGTQKPEYMMMTPSTRNKDYNTLAARATELSATYGFPNMANGDIYWTRSDHYNFAKNGIPTMFLCNGEHEDYHRPGDTADKIDGDKIARSAKLAFHLGYETANADERHVITGKMPKKEAPSSAPATGDEKK
jgi:hypothetical protein